MGILRYRPKPPKQKFVNETRQLIIDLRGGLPDACDFCSTVVPKDDLHPEEAGAWACINCIERWDKEDKAKKNEADELG